MSRVSDFDPFQKTGFTLTTRRRLDNELVRRGLFPTREQAQLAISEGIVLVGGSLADKPARLVDVGETVTVRGPSKDFVSRGGEKLEAALKRFDVEVEGSRVLDAGASTGGFTDCVLKRGASKVFAVDVGRGQLAEKLRTDSRVVVLDRTNIRNLELAQLEGRPVNLVVADLSFISLETVAPVLLGVAVEDSGDVVALVKPQFEAGRVEASKAKGVIKNPAVWAAVMESFVRMVTAHDARVVDLMVSPLRGAKGNVEFLAHIKPHAGNELGQNYPAELRIDTVIDEAIRMTS